MTKTQIVWYLFHKPSLFVLSLAVFYGSCDDDDVTLSNRNEIGDAGERLETRWRLKLIRVQTWRSSDLLRRSLLQTRRGSSSKPCRESRRYICRRHSWHKAVEAKVRFGSFYQIKNLKLRPTVSCLLPPLSLSPPHSVITYCNFLAHSVSPTHSDISGEQKAGENRVR